MRAQKESRARYARPWSQMHKIVNLFRERCFKFRQFLRGNGFGMQIAEDDPVFLVGDLPPHQDFIIRVLGGKLDRL